MSDSISLGHILRRGLLLVAPALVVVPAWIAFEVDGARRRVVEAATVAATEAASRIEDVLLRFERATAGLRATDASSDPAALASRLLRTEIAIAPATGLLIAMPRGRVVASTIPTAGLDPSGAWWLSAGVAATPSAAILAGPGPSPFGTGPAYALLRRIADVGMTGVVLATFVSADRLSEIARPSTLPEGANLILEPAAAEETSRVTMDDSLRRWLHTPFGETIGVRGALRVSVAPSQNAALQDLKAAVRERAPLVGGLILLLTALALVGSWRPRRAAVSSGEDEALRARAEAAEARLATAVEERDRTLATVGHDVRSPLNAILGLVALLLDGDMEDAQRRYLLQVRASCEVLLAMLNGMLEAASNLGDGRELYLERVEVAGIVAEVVEVFRPVAHDKGLEISFDAAADAGGSWQGDATRLRQVACNLVGNAVKYTDRGSVEVVLTRTADGLSLAVTDTGPGIAPEERGRIFERFGRGRAEVAQGREGLGLGLALCHEIAALMGGSVEVESKVGAGSTFRFSFPVAAVEGAPRRSLLRGRAALVVGLSEGVRRRTAEVLESLGCTVEAAADGFVGLGLAERIAHENAALDLVVLDAAITGLPAEAVLARLGASRALGSAQVLLVGGEGRSWTGVSASLAHPVEDRSLIAAVTGLFGTSMLNSEEAASVTAPPAVRVLVVDDSSVNRMLLTDVLKRADYTVFSAKDGEEAVAAAGRGGFDAVVMDVQMPGIDGVEATRRIRARLPGACPPILMLTAHTGAKVRRACLEAGATAVLHKPTDMARLPAQVGEAIDRAREEARTALGGTEPADIEGSDDLVDDAWFGAFLLEHGAPRARMLAEVFLSEGEVRMDRVEELLAAGQWDAAARPLREIHASAEALGAVILAEAVELVSAAVTARSPEESASALQAARVAWTCTTPALQHRLRRSLGEGTTRSRAA